MTIDEVFEGMRKLTVRQCAGEISKNEAAQELKVLIEDARLSMTDEQFLEIETRALLLHHDLAKFLSERRDEHQYETPGNDPRRPN